MTYTYSFPCPPSGQRLVIQLLLQTSQGVHCTAGQSGLWSRSHLQLRVDHEAPPGCISHDGSVLNAQGVSGQALLGPLGLGAVVREHVQRLDAWRGERQSVLTTPVQESVTARPLWPHYKQAASLLMTGRHSFRLLCTSVPYRVDDLVSSVHQSNKQALPCSPRSNNTIRCPNPPHPGPTCAGGDGPCQDVRQPPLLHQLLPERHVEGPRVRHKRGRQQHIAHEHALLAL